MKEATERAALLALLDDKTVTLTSKAEAAGISRRTLYSCLRDRRFVDKYQQARELQAIERAEGLAAARQKALDAISAIMDDETQPGAVRVSAAKLIITAEAEARARLDSVMRGCDLNARWT